MKFKFILLLMMLIGGLYTPLFSQNYDSIQGDIEIMETILNKMFSKDKVTFFDCGTNGYYLDGYGVLFKVPYSLKKFVHVNENYEKAVELYISKSNEFLTTSKAKKKAEDKLSSKKKFDKELQKIKDTLTRFLGDYISALNYLKSNYWVTIIVYFNSSSGWFDGFYEDKDINQLIAKVQMKDINSYRKGKLSFDRFKKKIQYVAKSNGDTAIDEDVDLFSDIMQSFLERNEKEKEFELSDGVKGIYLNGYGAIFMLKANMEPNILKVITTGDGKNSYSISTVSSSVDSQNINEKIKNMKKEIVSLLSRFGHTMRNLNSNEWLEIALNINAHGFDEDFSKYIMKIRKKDLNELNLERINLNEFKRRIKVITY